METVRINKAMRRKWPVLYYGRASGMWTEASWLYMEADSFRTKNRAVKVASTELATPSTQFQASFLATQDCCKTKEMCMNTHYLDPQVQHRIKIIQTLYAQRTFLHRKQWCTDLTYWHAYSSQRTYSYFYYSSVYIINVYTIFISILPMSDNNYVDVTHFIHMEMIMNHQCITKN